MKKILLFFVLFLNMIVINAQYSEPSHISLKTLIDEIDEKNNYTIFYNLNEIDGIYVSRQEFGDISIFSLIKYLEKTDKKLTIFNDFIFITAKNPIITDILFVKEEFIEFDEDDSNIMNYVLYRNVKKNQIVASSENIVYEIGNKSSFKENELVTIRGTVIDFKTMEPMIGINVYSDERERGAVTDTFGCYSLNILSGRREMFLQGLGVKNTIRQLMVYSGGSLNIELEEETHNLREVVISSEKLANVRSTSMGVELLKMKEIKNIPTAFGELDVVKVLLSLPGVKSVGEVSSGFNVRGGATDQNLILFNEGTIYNPSHLFGLFSVFNPDIIRDMAFYKSTIPPKYGGRISSVLDINTKEGDKQKFSGSVSIGLLTSKLTLETPLVREKVSLILAGRTTYSDWLLNALPEKSEFHNSNASFYDLNTLLSCKINENDNIYLSSYYSSDSFKYAEGEKYNYINANISAKWKNVLSQKLIANYTLGYDHYDFSTQNTKNATTAYRYSFAINQFFLKTDFKHFFNNKHTSSFGLNSLFYNLEPGDYEPKGSLSLVREDKIQTEKALESALYFGHIWECTSKLSFDAGFRLSMFNVLGKRKYRLYDSEYLPSFETISEYVEDGKGIIKTYLGPETRFSVRYAFSNDFSIKAGFNTIYQYIHKISNTTIMSPTDTWKLSDMNIKPQSGMQISVGGYKNFMQNGDIETSVEIYYKKMNNYLDYRAGAELAMNHYLETEVLNTEGRAYGIELMLKKNQGKLNGWMSYSYSRTELSQKDNRIINPANKGDWYPADFDKPHDVKFVGNYKFTHRYSVSLNCEYSTGRPITLPITKFVYDGGEYVYYSDRNQYRIPNYFRMDFSVNIEPSHHLIKLTHSMLSFGVYNLTGRKNPYSVYYVSEKGKLKGYKLAIYGVPIPYVSYNIRF